jgi:hypothetical protein
MTPYRMQSLHAFDDDAVEVHEWVDTSTLSALVASFARVHILLSVFNGDVDAWLQMIASSGTPTEVAIDAPFLIALKHRINDRPELVAELRESVRKFASLMA